MVVLCWSARAATSDWVKAEINHSLTANIPVLPWLLDSTPLPPLLQRTQGIQGTDPTKVVNELGDRRKKRYRRLAPKLAVGAVLLALVSAPPARGTARPYFGREPQALFLPSSLPATTTATIKTPSTT